jgi:hypothetical protein
MTPHKNTHLALFRKLLPALFVFIALTSEASIAHADTSFSLQEIKQSADTEHIRVRILVSAGASSINAAEAVIKYNPDIIELTSIQSQNSVFEIEAPVSLDNNNGMISLARGTLTPISDTKQTFADLIFRIKQQENVEISLLSSSIIVANDGEGTDIGEHTQHDLLIAQ